MSSSRLMSTMPMLMPDRSGILCTSCGLPRREAKAVRALAKVLTRIPNHATQ